MSLIPNLALLSGQTIVRKRFDVSITYVGGKPVKGASTTSQNIDASVQVPFGRFQQMINQEPEGKRTKEWIVIYVALDELKALDKVSGQSADVVTFEGKDFEIHNVTHRRGLRLNHDVALAVRVK